MSPEAKQNKAEAIRSYLKEHPKAKAKAVVEALREQEIEVKEKYVVDVRHKAKKAKKKRK